MFLEWLTSFVVFCVQSIELVSTRENVLNKFLCQKWLITKIEDKELNRNSGFSIFINSNFFSWHWKMYSRKKLAQAVTPLWNYLQLLDIVFGEWLTESINRDDDLKREENNGMKCVANSSKWDRKVREEKTIFKLKKKSRFSLLLSQTLVFRLYIILLHFERKTAHKSK